MQENLQLVLNSYKPLTSNDGVPVAAFFVCHLHCKSIGVNLKDVQQVDLFTMYFNLFSRFSAPFPY